MSSPNETMSYAPVNPLELSDEAFKQQYSEPTPAEATSYGVENPLELSDEAFKKSFSEESITPQAKPENDFNPVNSFFQHTIGDNWNQGQGATIIQGNIGLQVMAGSRSYEDALKDADMVRLEELTKDTTAYNDQFWDTDPRKWIGSAMQSLPMMVEIKKEGLKYGAVGAGIGAGAGLLGGPFAELSSPAGAAMGWTWGQRQGEFITSAKLMAGQTYFDYRKAGLDHDSARNAAIASGAISGFIETLQIKQLAAPVRRQLAKAFASKAGQQIARNFFTQYAKEVGIQVTEEVLQQWTQLAGQQIAAEMTENEKAKVTGEEFMKQTVQTIIQSVQASLVLVGGGHVAGKVTEGAANVAKDQAEKRGTTLAEMLQHLREGMGRDGAEAPTPEQAQAETAGVDVNQILDNLHQAVPEPTKTVVGRIQEVVQAITNPQEAPVENQPEAPQDPILDAPIGEDTALEVKGRINQIKADIAAIDTTLNALERKMVTNAAEGKPNTAVSAQIEKLYDKRSDLDDELVVLKNSEVTKDELSGKNIKLKADDIFRLKAKAAKETIKRYRQGVKEGTKFTKEQTLAVQNRLVSLIKKSGMTLNDQAKFIQRIKNVQTPEQLATALPKVQTQIDALVEKQAKRDATKRLNRTMEQSKLKKSGKYPVGKFTADIQQSLDIYRKAITDPNYREAVLNGAIERAKIGAEATPQQELEVAIVNDVGNPDEKTGAQLEKLNESIRQLIEEGKSDALDKHMMQQEENQALKDAAIQSIQGDKPVLQRMNPDAIKTKIEQAARTAGAEAETWRGLTLIASSDDKQHTLAEILDPTESREKYFELKDTWEARISKSFVDVVKKLEKKYGKNAPAKLKQKLGADEKVQIVGDYQDIDGNTQTLERSTAELRKLWMEMQAAKVNDVIRASLQQGNKFTFRDDVQGLRLNQKSTEQLVEESLAPEDIWLAEAQFKVYDDVYNELVNPYWREKFGTDLPKEEFYSPIMREGIDVNDDSTLLDLFVGGEGGIKPTATIKRSKSLAPLAAQSDISALARHVEQATRFVAYDEFDRKSKMLLNNGKIRTIIQNKYGKKFLALLNTHRRDITTGRQLYNDVAWAWVDNLRRKTAIAYISAKIGSIPKQATAMFTALDRVGPVEFGAALLKVSTNPIGVAKKLRKSATLRRLMQATDRDVVEVLNQRKNEHPWVGGDALMNVILMPMRIGVGYGTLVSGEAVYTKAINTGATEAEALNEMNKFLTDTQQAGFIENQSALERNGALSRLVTMFGGDPLQAARQIVRANREILAHPKDAKNYAKALRTYAVFHVTVPVMFQAASLFFDSDDEGEYDVYKLIRAAIFGPWGQIPILGDTLNYAAIKAQNSIFGTNEYAFEPTNPVLSAFIALAKYPAKQIQAWEEDDFDKQLQALDYLAKGSPVLPKLAGGGLPWPEFMKWLKKFLEFQNDNPTITD